MNVIQTRNLEAFLRAIAVHKTTLPPNIQQEIRRIGQDLQQHKTQSLDDIPELVQQDDELEHHYNQIYRKLQQQATAQERTKSLAAATAAVSLDNETLIAQLFYADNLTESIQQFLARVDQQKGDHTKTDLFWERGYRVISLATGGAFLGVLLAQIPGAVAGGILAALYGWFSARDQKTEMSDLP